MTMPTLYGFPVGRVSRARIFALVRKGVPMFHAVTEVINNPKPHIPVKR